MAGRPQGLQLGADLQAIVHGLLQLIENRKIFNCDSAHSGLITHMTCVEP